MSPQQMQEILQQSFTDRPLSRSERKDLAEQIAAKGLNSQQLSVFRSLAFQLANQFSGTAPCSEVLEWLEEVTKVLQRFVAEAENQICEAWFSPQSDCPNRIRSLFAQAKSSVDVCVFTITDDRLTSAVMDAHGRGVKIRIITDNDKAADLGSDADRFLEAGVALRVDRSDYHMHHKFAIFDQTVLLTGSYNWTRGAAENNEENFIVTDNRKLVAEFSKVFEVLWRQFSD